MENALLYCVNNNKWNKTYLHQMVNSINSFYANNPQSLLDTLTVYILTDKKAGLDLSKLNPNVNRYIIEEKDFSYDYSTIPTTQKQFPYQVYFRWEMFNNPIFKNIDTMLYLDCDTEIVAPVDELFYPKTVCRIGLVPENNNWLKTNHDIDTNNYCNSGVIFTTPKLIMDEPLLSDMFPKLVDFAKETQFAYVDQDALNLLLSTEPYGRILMLLPNIYNSFRGTWVPGSEGPTNPKIIHHAGSCFTKLYPLKYI